MKLLIALAAWVCCIVLPSGAQAAEDRIYYFVDEHGVLNLSNVPDDPRYTIYTASTSLTEPAPATPVQGGPDDQFMLDPGEDTDLAAEPPPEPAAEPPQTPEEPRER